MFGSHLSIAGGMTNAIDEAQRLNMDCVQVFTKNQRQWRVRPLTDTQINDWIAALKSARWDYGPRRRSPKPARTVSHNSYLINLASPDPEMWKRSVDLHRIELERCEALHIPFCVGHPGAHRGDAPPTGHPLDLEAEPTKDELAGLRRIVKALDSIHRDLPGYRTITCLETTTGSGSNLGYSFQQLAWIRERVHEPDRVGFCLDTCHVTAAGYDMSTERKAADVLRRFNRICGLGRLHVLHLNDSVGAVGSRRDRHAHIGRGCCGLPCFRAIVNHRRLARVPKILETPKGNNEKGVPWDVVNIRRLKRLIRCPVSSR